MQSDKASRLRLIWGDKPCKHDEIDDEFYLGSRTEDFVCIQCGKLFTRDEYLELQKKRNNKLNK
jgi:hypothetical protein